MKKIVLMLMVILFVSVSFAFAQEEKITISTYYPSPYGVYKTLRIFPSDDIDITAPCQNDGEVIYDDSENRAYICSNGKWTALGGGGAGGALECVWVTSNQKVGTCLGCVHLKAYCPDGYTVVGGGGNCGKWLNYMYTSHPDRQGNAWGVNCKGTCGGNNCSWNPKSYASALCCKNVVFPPATPEQPEPEEPPEPTPSTGGGNVQIYTAAGVGFVQGNPANWNGNNVCNAAGGKKCLGVGFSDADVGIGSIACGVYYNGNDPKLWSASIPIFFCDSLK